MEEDKIKEGIKSLLDSIANKIHEEGLDKTKDLAPFMDHGVFDKAFINNNPQHYYLGLEFNIDKALDAFVATRYDSREVQFIFRHYSFIELSIKNLIKQYEGWTCCADKSRTIVARLVDFYLDGKPITFNYNQEYTYHLPKVIFTDQDQITEFFNALQHLYYGRNLEYLQWVTNYLKDLKPADSSKY